MYTFMDSLWFQKDFFWQRVVDSPCMFAPTISLIHNLSQGKGKGEGKGKGPDEKMTFSTGISWWLCLCDDASLNEHASFKKSNHGTYMTMIWATRFRHLGATSCTVTVGFIRVSSTLGLKNRDIQAGPLPVISGVLTPIGRIITSVTHLFFTI